MKSIYWPAIIQYDNDPELEYLENEAAWNKLADSFETGFEDNDRLIDNKGQVFFCNKLANQLIDTPMPDEMMALETVLGLVKAHLADSGSCCVAKAYAPTIQDAIGMIKNNECRID
jgi:hypothetical protein